ncbi:hypothetical protein N7452_007136 [Penicillium brevicompactum]|uniref:Uncharacterized protein n=1 Tax=Penicillium brevicompactum TaxID=5074 RepID=A0A9W9QEW1_PENBR|nr:hypothetical protein N7452_007136 [Penicillium brevicompactum]
MLLLNGTMVSTRSSHQSLPTIPEHPAIPENTNIPNATPDTSRQSDCPTDPTFKRPSSGFAARTAISDFPTAFSAEPSYQAGNVSGISEPLAEQPHDTSDLLTSPSTIMIFRNDKLTNPEFEDTFSPVPAKQPDEDEPKVDLQLQREVEADLEVQSEASNVMPENLEVNSTPSQMQAGRSSESLRSFIVGSRQLLKVEEEKLDEIYKPESGDVLIAHQEMDENLSKYEKSKRDYEWRKMKQEAYSAQQVEIRNRRRQLDEAERELDDLCH